MPRGRKPGEAIWRTPNRYVTTICNELHVERVRLNIAQSDLAETIGIHPYTLSNWEHGRSHPGLFYLLCWTQALGFSLHLKKEKL